MKKIEIGILSVLLGVLLLAAFISGCDNQKQQNLNTGDDKVTTEVETTPAPALTASNESLVNELFSFEGQKSKVVTSTLPTARYVVEFMTDKPVRFMMLNEASYKFWIAGNYGQAKITTNGENGCCAAEGRYMVDVNNGEDGNYYFVFEDNLGDGPTQGKVIVNKIAEFNQ
jgi:hypothetical protein